MPEGMTKTQKYKGYSVREYWVENVPNGMDDVDIIDYCLKPNFGGRVVKGPKGVYVYVYTD
jgi:hypothetical protein